MWSVGTRERVVQCFRCGSEIAPTEIAATYTSALSNQYSRDGQGHYHPACLVDLSAETALGLLSPTCPPFEDRARLYQLASDRALLIKAAKLGEKARAKLGELPAVEQARDPMGRPRVRVLLTGNAASLDPRLFDADGTFVIDEAVRDYVRDRTIVAPLREYVLVQQLSSPNLYIDPSQPIVAGVMIMHVATAPASAYKARVADMRALGLAAPILCVLGASDAAVIDAYVLELRTLVEQAGYSADECPVLTAEQRSRALFEALAHKLDEHVRDGAVEAEADAAVRAAAQLARTVDEGAIEAISTALKRALKVVRRARVAEKRAIAEGAVRCLRWESTRRIAIELIDLSAADVPLEPVLAAIDDVLAARALNADLAPLCAIVRGREGGEDALDRALLAAVIDAKPGSKRSEVLFAELARSGCEATIAPVTAAAEAHPKLAPKLEACAAEIDATVLRDRAAAEKKKKKRYTAPATGIADDRSG